MPAMIKAFPPGSYTIKVGNGKRASLTVKDDPELGRKWDQDILTRIRKGESFASFVAGKYPRKSLTEALLQDLLSDNEQVVARATGPLSRVPELPDCSAGIVSKAIAKNLARAKQSHDNAAILDSLGWVGANIGTDEALEPILHLSQTENPREAVVLALGKFKHEKAAEQLRRLLNDQHKNIQFRAAQILADRRDPAALDVLLVLAHDPKSTWRMYSFEALLNYRDDPRVKPAIKSGLNDIDSSVRASAKSALRTLHTAKKP